MIDRQKLFKLSPDVLSQDIDKETVLLDMKSENYFGINDVGRRVLDILKNGANIASIVKLLLNEYDIDENTLEKDVRFLLQQLLDSQLIQSCE